jgi:hypothetical protein
MELFNAVRYCWNNLKGENAPITQKKEKKNNKYLQITYKVRGCHKLYILLATPSSPMSLLLYQKMSEIHCGGEGSTITNIPSNHVTKLQDSYHAQSLNRIFFLTPMAHNQSFCEP